MKKSITIEYDVVNSEMEIKDDEDLSYLELVGLLEFAKLMITKDYIREHGD
jgi:hypothetical protein